MSWPQETKNYAVFFANELLEPDPNEDRALETVMAYFEALASETLNPMPVREAAQKAAQAHANLIQARQQAVQALEEFEEAAFQAHPPLSRPVVRKPKRHFNVSQPA